MRYLLLFFITLGFSCTHTNPATAQSKLKPDAFEAMLKKDSSTQLVDVRTPEEFQGGYIAGATNINLQGADFNQRVSALDKSRPVMVYCAVGGRSTAAAKKLTQMGFPKVYDLEGGMGAWKAAGKAVKQ